jgi:hypothetical protein
VHIDGDLTKMERNLESYLLHENVCCQPNYFFWGGGGGEGGEDEFKFLNEILLHFITLEWAGLL